MEPRDLDADPLRQLHAWMEVARASGEPLPEAMCVATADAQANPSARFVLMRGLDDGVVFYTSYESDKAHDLAANPRAAAVFRWHRPVHRQVRISGATTKVSAEESDRYWATRPVDSRLSALASRQSRVVESREALDAAVRALSGDDPARPAGWGGYRILPSSVEFWEERPNRLHDRLRYLRERDAWRVDRLAP